MIFGDDIKLVVAVLLMLGDRFTDSEARKALRESNLDYIDVNYLMLVGILRTVSGERYCVYEVSQIGKDLLK